MKFRTINFTESELPIFYDYNPPFTITLREV